MVILFAMLTAIGAASPPAKISSRARAGGAIVSGRKVSSETWVPKSNPAQREIIKVEKDGQTNLIRLTELE